MAINLALYESKLEEILANARILQMAGPLLAKNRATFLVALAPLGPSGQRAIASLERLTEDAALDNTSGFQGLILLISGVLESFIAKAIDDYISDASKSNSFWSDEDRAVIRSRYLARAGVGLQHMASGTWNGVNFDFERLIANLAVTLADDDMVQISGDVFVARFGTCTPKKIEDLFEKLKIKGPFDTAFGRHKDVFEVTKDKTPTTSARYFWSELEKLADLRNDLAHGLATSQVTFTSVETYFNVVRGFMRGVVDRLSVPNSGLA